MSKENQIYNISPINEAILCTPCLLCGKSVHVHFHNDFPRVCEDCKTLWKKIKEKDNEQRAD